MWGSASTLGDAKLDDANSCIHRDQRTGKNSLGTPQENEHTAYGIVMQ